MSHRFANPPTPPFEKEALLMAPKLDHSFYQRIRAIRKLITLEIASLHMRHQHSGDPLLAEWIERLQTCLRVTQLTTGNDGDTLTP